jgi:hypothetical protein
VLKDGGLMCWGSNSEGQLGTGNTTDKLIATSVSIGIGAEQHLESSDRRNILNENFTLFQRSKIHLRLANL